MEGTGSGQVWLGEIACPPAWWVAFLYFIAFPNCKRNLWAFGRAWERGRPGPLYRWRPAGRPFTTERRGSRRCGSQRPSKRRLFVRGGRLCHVALDLDVSLPVAGRGNVAGGLHPNKGVHPRAESLLDAQRHGGRELTPSALAACVTERPRGSITSILMNCPGWVGRAIRIMVSFPLSDNPRNSDRRFLVRSDRS